MHAALLTLSWLSSAAGARIAVKLATPGKNEECPLERTFDGLLVYQGEGEGSGDCCDNGARLFNCDVIRFGRGDEVKWNNFDEEVPEGTVGKVAKIELPMVMVEFPNSLFWMEFDDLIPVNSEPEDEHWFCKCDECLEVEKLVHTFGYKVEHKGHHLRTWANFNTRQRYIGSTTVPPLGLVLFIYPAEDENDAFAYREMLCKRISCWHQRGYDVSMRVVSSVTAALSLMNRFDDRAVHHIVIGGHGTETSITWGKSGTGGRLAVDDPNTNKFLLKLRAKLQLDATVTLDSCKSAGEVKKGSNIWKAFGKALPGRQVKGATMNLKEHMWIPGDQAECLAGDTAVFKEKGVTKMRVRMSGKPHCLEVTDRDIELAVGQNKLCLSQCWPYSCKSAFSTLKERKVITDNLFTLEDSGLPPESDDCYVGTKTVCVFGYKGLPMLPYNT